MPRTKKTSPSKPVKISGDTGAPAALKALQEHEHKFRLETEKAYEVWQETKGNLVDGDSESERVYIRAHREYTEVLEIWHDALKKLLAFEKAVPEAKRDGEKILVSDAVEYFRQYSLSISLAIEQYILQQAQSAALCDSPEDFVKAHGENIRAAKQGAIDAALNDGKLPNWIA